VDGCGYEERLEVDFSASAIARCPSLQRAAFAGEKAWS